ncbi:hypothetical protein, partial [Syntrophaceticus schinkii]
MKLRGTAYTVISSVFFGILPIFVKFALNTGLKTNQIILIHDFRLLLVFFPFSLTIYHKKRYLRVSRNSYVVLVILV